MKIFGQAHIASTSAHGINLALDGGASFSVDVLENTLFRVRYTPVGGYKEPRTWAIAPQPGIDVPWAGRRRDALDGFSRPEARVSNAEHQATLRTKDVALTLAAHPLTLTWHNAQGQLLLTDRATSAYFASERTGAVRHYLQRDRAERYYGLGDKTGPLDLHGRRLRTLGLDSLGYDPKSGDPLYKHWPFVLTRAATGQWYGIYYDTLATCTFDLGCEHDNYHEPFRYVEIDDGDLDYYFMVGQSPAEVIAQFVKLIGGTHLPPRWSLGFAQTAMGLADADDAQAQLDNFIGKIESEGVPCSSFHYGSGYSSRGKRRYVFTWNHSKFPDPKALNKRFHEAGMNVVANIKPCLLNDHPAYAEVLAQGGFINEATSPKPIVEQFWDGVGSHLDFTHPAAVAWWKNGLKTMVLDYGIEVGWNDNNEYSVMDDAATCHGFGTSMPMHRTRGLHPLLMTRATFEAQDQAVPNEPVFTITRGGSPGIQRYAQTWSGDNTTSWETMRWNIRTGLQMSLSGMFNIGHDVGGFFGPSPNADMLVRWVQACCLNPRMVMNSWKPTQGVTVPWLHPEATADVVAAIGLRYTLMPYLWALFERASQHHEPIIRPTFYDFPDDEACFADCDDFMLGHDLLVAPVVQAGATQRTVYLPKIAGVESAWFDFYTGERFEAGQTITVDAPRSKLPLFARAGAAIPLSKAVQKRQRHDDPVSEVRRFGQ